MPQTPHPTGPHHMIGVGDPRRDHSRNTGGVFIRGLWESQTEAISYVRFVDADTETYN